MAPPLHPRNQGLLPNQRCCSICNEIKPFLDFYSSGGGRNGGTRKMEPYCKICKYQKDRARLDQESVKAHRAKLMRQYRQNNKESHARKAKEHRIKLRLEVIEAYGGKCVCCGETHPEFLAIDHIHGGGSGYRKIKGAGSHVAGTGFYLWLRKLGFPKDIFRLLCHNCNMARGCYGYCPHEKNVPEMILPAPSFEEMALV